MEALRRRVVGGWVGVGFTHVTSFTLHPFNCPAVHVRVVGIPQVSLHVHLYICRCFYKTCTSLWAFIFLHEPTASRIAVNTVKGKAQPTNMLLWCLLQNNGSEVGWTQLRGSLLLAKDIWFTIWERGRSTVQSLSLSLLPRSLPLTSVSLSASVSHSEHEILKELVPQKNTSWQEHNRLFALPLFSPWLSLSFLSLLTTNKQETLTLPSND